jgi:hypothetical protein
VSLKFIFSSQRCKTCPFRQANKKALSVANLPAGMYVWIFKTDKGVEKGKLLIEK